MDHCLSWTRGEFSITTDNNKISLDVVHAFLANESFWAKNIPRHTVARSITHSLCFGLFKNDEQIGYARVITDRATIAYLGDVFVLASHRGQGHSRWLMECLTSHPDLQGLRRWVLLTSDAHGLYEKFGFSAIDSPQMWMQKFNAQVYALQTVSPVAA